MVILKATKNTTSLCQNIIDCQYVDSISESELRPSSNELNSNFSVVEEESVTEVNLLPADDELKKMELSPLKTYGCSYFRSGSHRKQKSKTHEEEYVERLQKLADKMYASSLSGAMTFKKGCNVINIPKVPRVIRSCKESFDQSDDGVNTTTKSSGLSSSPNAVFSTEQQYSTNSSRKQDDSCVITDLYSFISRSRGPSAPGSSLRSSNDDDDRTLFLNMQSQVSACYDESDKKLSFNLNEMLQKPSLRPLLSMKNMEDKVHEFGCDKEITQKIITESESIDCSDTIEHKPTVKVKSTSWDIHKRNDKTRNKRFSELSTEKLNSNNRLPHLAIENRREEKRPEILQSSKLQDEYVPVAKKQKRQDEISDVDVTPNELNTEKNCGNISPSTKSTSTWKYGESFKWLIFKGCNTVEVDNYN